MPDNDRSSPEIDRVRLETVDSTNDEARRRIEADPRRDRPLVVRADVQTAGRGRQGRAWSSPPGGLWMTLAAPLPGPVPPALGLRLGLALTEPIADHLAPEHDARLKWPNDVIVASRKVAGLLVEIHAIAGRSWALVGAGVNADAALADLPEATRPGATTLREITGRSGHVGALSPAVERSLLDALASSEPVDRLARRAEARLAGLGKTARLRLPSGDHAEGVLTGLSPDARAILELPTGERFTAPHAVEFVDEPLAHEDDGRAEV